MLKAIPSLWYFCDKFITQCCSKELFLYRDQPRCRFQKGWWERWWDLTSAWENRTITLGGTLRADLLRRDVSTAIYISYDLQCISPYVCLWPTPIPGTPLPPYPYLPLPPFPAAPILRFVSYNTFSHPPCVGAPRLFILSAWHAICSNLIRRSKENKKLKRRKWKFVAL